MAQGNLSCILTTVCSKNGPVKSLTSTAIETLLKSAEEQGDEEVRLRITENSQSGSINVHQSCYCTYTSSEKIARLKKRKSEADDSVASPPKTRNKTQSFRGPDLSSSFDFKKSCIFCGKECLPKDPTNPKRWDRVIKCMSIERLGAPTFQNVLLDI